jgi:large subunit ribosomal protein L13
MIIDATNQVLGMVASYAAKKSLLGEKVEIVNCEQAVVTGTKANIMARYRAKRERGDPFHGPYFPRHPDRLMRRTIRGMLPRRQEKGQLALKRVRCYNGVPEAMKDSKAGSVKGADVSKMSNLKYMKLGEICSLLGGKT